ncbi:MAG TPA: DUF2911 domain-containing protein [Chitinophagaceae bacterium]|nr:DUF2911 domain-containing protein [Chitinophagaceae bacterium]
MQSKFYLVVLLLCSMLTTTAQNLTIPPNGGNKKASVSERIGITDVTIHYDRPGVKGREGKIWNNLVHTGFTDLGFGTSKQAPWRAGANENTTITFSTDVMVEGKKLQAGTYGFFVAMGTSDATLIFSNNTTSWGSFFYDPKEDALRVTVKTEPLNESVEWLKYEFTNETDNSAVIALMWEKLKIPFKVEIDYSKTQLAMFRNELRSDKGFNSDTWVQAAQFAASNNDLEDALKWSDYSINGVFVGQKNFKTLSTKAMILNKQGKSAEADAVIKEALPLGNMIDLHQYGRQLITEKKPKEALDVFKMNAQKNPNVFTTDVGLARGYSATGDYKNALKYAKLAQPLAPDKANKDAVTKMIDMLGQGKDVN